MTEVLREAQVLHGKRQYAEADKLLRRATQMSPHDLDAWNIRGINLRKMQRQTEAVWCFRRALEIADDRAGVWSNLGNALKDLKHTRSAVSCHLRAVALAPRDAGSQHNLGIALRADGRHADALAAFDRALEIDPKNAGARWDRALAHLHLGDLAPGWIDYEARHHTGQLPRRPVPGRPWTGERYGGKRLLIVSEQGMGDAIWIARYLKQVKELGGELVMECRPETIPLIASMGICDQLVPKRDPLPEADLHAFQCRLPGLFTPDLSAIPAAPYIVAERARYAKFAEPLALGAGKLRVGVVWSGSPTFEANAGPRGAAPATAPVVRIAVGAALQPAERSGRSRAQVAPEGRADHKPRALEPQFRRYALPRSRSLIWC